MRRARARGAAPGTDLQRLGFTYGTATTNNGNVTAATILARAGATFNFSQQFGYDGLNRLKTASEANSGGTGWNQWYVIDGVGNRAVLAGTYQGVQYWVPNPGWTPQVSDPTPELLAQHFPYNRWDGATYDGGSAINPNQAGIMTGLAGWSFVYDGENRMVQSTSPLGAVTTYLYDGDGRRVQKTSGGVTTTFVYDAGGELASEYASGAPPAAPCATCYLTADHLGSTRAVVDGTSGQVVELHDYLPFGEEIGQGVNGRTALWGAAYPNQKFTGKERDTETGLDYFGARYLSSAQGRFTSPDPKRISSQWFNDPQQWNAYCYTRNNPVIYIDPDGMELTPIKVYVTGGKQEIRYIDSRLVTRLQNAVSSARTAGMTFTFNEVFRTQAKQDSIKTGNTKNTTGTSPHAAGVAFDVNVSTSLKPNGSKSLPDLTTAVGAKDSNFSPLSNQAADAPHFQANDLITRDSKGNVDQTYKDLIEENQQSYEDLETLRKDKPEEFNQKVVEIDSYTDKTEEKEKQKPEKKP